MVAQIVHGTNGGIKLTGENYVGKSIVFSERVPCTNALKEQAAKWLSKDELGSVEWLPADIGLVERLRERM